MLLILLILLTGAEIDTGADKQNNVQPTVRTHELALPSKHTEQVIGKEHRTAEWILAAHLSEEDLSIVGITQARAGNPTSGLTNIASIFSRIGWHRSSSQLTCQ